MKKRVAVLGATGSIGRSSLEILRNENKLFEPVLFSANKNREELIKLKKEFPSALTALAGDGAAANGGSVSTNGPAAGNSATESSARDRSITGGRASPGIDFSGPAALFDAIKAAGADITVNGISGAAGLEPSIAALNAGSDLALANKETVVMAGKLVFSLAREKKLNIIPVDSEHYAVYRLMEAHGRENVAEIILTASGGPFRNHTIEQLRKVTVKEALAHPTWNMGPKITVDSATLANKGLEVIEAARLFAFPPEKIRVVLHPQSIVHSMVRLKDGAVYAQMSKPDMKLPISGALSWPDTVDSPYGFLDFDKLSLDFEKPDFERFPMLALAYEALKGSSQGSSRLPVYYNAANEIAVEAFFREKIGFTDIPRIVAHVMRQNQSRAGEDDSLDTILAFDREARICAREYINTKEEFL